MELPSLSCTARRHIDDLHRFLLREMVMNVNRSIKQLGTIRSRQPAESRARPSSETLSAMNIAVIRR